MASTSGVALREAWTAPSCTVLLVVARDAFAEFNESKGRPRGHAFEGAEPGVGVHGALARRQLNFRGGEPVRAVGSGVVVVEVKNLRSTGVRRVTYPTFFRPK